MPKACRILAPLLLLLAVVPAVAGAGATIRIDDSRSPSSCGTCRWACRWTGRMLPPTGKAVTVSKMDFFRVQSGLVTEHWDVIDRMGLLQQLGVVPRLPRWEQTTGYEESFR